MILEINELAQDIRKSFQEYINVGRGEEYAVGRIFYEFDVFEDDSESIVEDMISMMAIGELIINTNCFNMKIRDRLKRTFGKIDLFIDELKEKITENELNDLLMRIKKIDEALDTDFA